MSDTATLFSLDMKTEAPSGVDWDSLRRFCFLYTATSKGNNSGIRFMMTREDAEAWCGSSKSRGTGQGGGWAYFFTSTENFVRHHCGDDVIYAHGKYVVSLKGLSDDGRYDADIESLGLTKIPLSDFRKILEPLGVICTGEPTISKARK